MFIWLFLNLIKVTALSIYYFLFFLFWESKIFVLFINAGIEPAFSVKFGNRTRIYIVFKGIEPWLCKSMWRWWADMKENFMEKKFFILCMQYFYLGNRTLRIYLMMVKSFWGDNDVVLKYFCYCKTLNGYLLMWCDPFLQRFRNT